ncbi:Panacea domain-containing protein [Phyllobacterium leguminum]|uniref:Panacea domain-containing protein n=1 Tax=Phyllobacterium leguminum TaxID=314237 RepID=UPI000DA19F27|nr:type II toxin-antitoxin system antitoxin SocA domain-containing protein [Phyllobacterium leguminum]
MGINTLRAAKTICESKNWQLSNLPLQKLVYLSHMVHLGMYDQPLIDGTFQAWDLGPVEPSLYAKVKAYGNKPIPDIFGVPSFPIGSTQRTAINEVLRQIGDRSPSVLVEITHQPHGAWAQHYQRHMMGIKIPDQDIKGEYEKRIRRATSKKSA